MIDELTKKLIADSRAMLEGKKLDPVGKADADVDNDGDVDSSDEYLKKRRAAIGKAMKDEGNEFTKALMVARKNGDQEFVVAGKKYTCDEVEELEKDLKSKEKLKEKEVTSEDAEEKARLALKHAKEKERMDSKQEREKDRVNKQD
jgi:hypothetical protein